jgi:hypothetical protein
MLEAHLVKGIPDLSERVCRLAVKSDVNSSVSSLSYRVEDIVARCSEMQNMVGTKVYFAFVWPQLVCEVVSHAQIHHMGWSISLMTHTIVFRFL